MDRNVKRIGPWSFGWVGTSMRVSFHGLEIPRVVSVNGLGSRVVDSEDGPNVYITVQVKPGDPEQVPQDFMKDALVNDLMERCLLLEESNAELRKQIAGMEDGLTED